MGFLALFTLLCGRALVNKLSWPQAIEAESIVFDDVHFLSLGQIIEYFASKQRMFGLFARHTVVFHGAYV